MTQETFDRFKDRTHIDIQQFFTDFVNFFDNYYQNITDYYTIGSELNSDTLIALSNLNTSAKQIKGVFNTLQSILSNYYDNWELLDQFEDCCIKIETVYNSNKWFRANKGLTFDSKTEKTFILRQNQTLTSLADEIGYSDPNNDWVELALRNNLREDDYTEDGGVNLKVVFQNNSEYSLKGVLAPITGQSIYGLDINKKITYVDDDIDTLDNTETRDQAFSILMNLFKGNVPEFIADGIDKGLTGSNINSFQYPIVIRQMSDIFAKDDLFKSVGISNIYREQDNVFMTVSAKTRVGDVLGENLKLV